MCLSLETCQHKNRKWLSAKDPYNHVIPSFSEYLHFLAKHLNNICISSISSIYNISKKYLNTLLSVCLNRSLTLTHSSQSFSKATNENKFAGLPSPSTFLPQILLSLPFPPLIPSSNHAALMSHLPSAPSLLLSSDLHKPLPDFFWQSEWMNKWMNSLHMIWWMKYGYIYVNE